MAAGHSRGLGFGRRACPPGHQPGADGKAGQCPQSYGILQNRYPFEQASWPGIGDSTAMNADTAYAIWRSCYDGYETWLNTVPRGQTYAKGDLWGCVGRWFARPLAHRPGPAVRGQGPAVPERADLATPTSSSPADRHRPRANAPPAARRRGNRDHPGPADGVDHVRRRVGREQLVGWAPSRGDRFWPPCPVCG